MYPVIYDFGKINLFGFEFHLAIYSFGLMLVVAFYTCYYLLENDLKNSDYDDKLASDIIFWSALGGIFGSKFYHVIENLDRIMASSDPFGEIFSGSGLVFFGGLAGAVIAVSFVLKSYKVPWFEFADRLAPLIFLGYAIGRIGCFLVGDDYGIPSKLPWAISFPDGLPPTTKSVFAYQFPWTVLAPNEVQILHVPSILRYLLYVLPIQHYFLQVLIIPLFPAWLDLHHQIINVVIDYFFFAVS